MPFVEGAKSTFINETIKKSIEQYGGGQPATRHDAK